MARADISDYLIHFTSGDTEEDAFCRLQNIVAEGCLYGSNRMIRGGYNCVCFSEAPLQNLESGLVNPQYYSRYSPFGIMVTKTWFFLQGGRPVIYQLEGEFEQLPETHRWRHVRYDLGANPPIDFSWEREWRIHTDALNFDSDVACIVVPDGDWAERLIAEHEWEQESRVQQYSAIFDEEHARLMFHRGFWWDIYTLR